MNKPTRRQLLSTLLGIPAVPLARGVRAAELGGKAVTVTREQVDALVKPLIDGHWCQGMVVSVVGPDAAPVYAYGTADKPMVKLDGRTVFEIGSITKAFTGILLAEMVGRGEVALNDPAEKYLPAGTKLPKWENEPITLLHLSTHTSGLPRMPNNFRPANPANPYADYTVQNMLDFLAAHKLARKPGEKSDYSNLGTGLLGHVLARRAGKTYEELLLQRVCKPLGLEETRITLTASQRERLAAGHTSDGGTAGNWDLPTFAGAGALRSTVDDMIRFVRANIEPPKGPLGDALRLSHEKRFPVDGNTTMGLGWHRNERDGIVWHNGQTGGYHSFAAAIPGRRCGVVVLSNTATELVDAVGGNLLRIQVGDAPNPPKLRPTLQLDAKTLDAYVGQYTLAPGAVLTVARNGDHLTAQLTGQDAFRIYGEAKDRFYYRIVEAQLTFERDDQNKIKGLTLHQNGRDLKAPRK